jgi:TetR/AcrR family transcriptional regulator
MVNETRDRILRAATEVFSAIGFAGARVDDIAERAGVNKALLYYHVGGKDELYSAVLTETIDHAYESIRQASESSDDPAVRMQRVLDAFAQFGTSNPQFVPIMLREIASGGATLPDETLQRMAKAFRVVADLLADGMKSGAFRASDPLLTHVSVIGSMMFLVATQPIRERLARVAGVEHRHSLEDLAAHTGALFLHGLEVDKSSSRRRQVDKSSSRRVVKEKSTRERAPRTTSRAKAKRSPK